MASGQVAADRPRGRPWPGHPGGGFGRSGWRGRDGEEPRWTGPWRLIRRREAQIEVVVLDSAVQSSNQGD
jgi:hypothetical protein